MSFTQSASWTRGQITIVCVADLRWDHGVEFITSDLVLGLPHESLDPTKSSVTQPLVPEKELFLLLGQVMVIVD